MPHGGRDGDPGKTRAAVTSGLSSPNGETPPAQPIVILPGMIACQSGNHFNIIQPDAATIDFRDVARALANLCRFTGHVNAFYSVAQHSCLVAAHVPDLVKPYALIHDAKEAFIGDWSTPLKQAVSAYDKGARHVIDAIDTYVDKAIHEAAGLSWPPLPAIASSIKKADLRALVTERDALGLYFGADWPADANHSPFDDLDDADPAHGCWQPVEAEREFLEMFNRLFPGLIGSAA